MRIKLFESESFRKRIAILLCISIVFNSIFLPASIYAEESPPQESIEQQSTSTPETTPTTESNTQTQSNPPPPTETPAPTSEIQTGNAGSLASSDNTVNFTESTTDGNVATGDCSVDVNLGCDPSATVDAQVSGETAAESTTGVNEITGAEGGAEIGTGDAVSQSSAANQLNTNIVEATDEAQLENESNNDSGQAGMTNGEVLTVVQMDNTATLEATASATSVSGQNAIVESGGNATVDTGASIAQAAQANVVNTNILGSNFEFFVLPIVTDQNGDINLNELWQKLQQKIAEQSANLDGAANVLIVNTNEATLDLNAVASAISGQNSLGDNAGDATILTGDSIATANIFNLINLNIIGSNFLFGVINIFGNLTGNIIVPSPARFLEYLASNNLISESEIASQNYALISSNVASTADSGTNEQIDEETQLLQTGDSIAYAASTNFANLNLLMSSWYFLILNNFGFWDGTVDSWENPASSVVQDDETATYEMDNQAVQTLDLETIDGSGDTSVLNENAVTVNANVAASAISGQNSTWNNLASLIRSGRSIALANLFNFLNTNIIGSNFFMPIINLFGGWTGNLVFAYPRLEVAMAADKEEVNFGDNLNYTVNYSNVGYEEARNVTLNINLPQEASVNSASGLSFEANGKSLKFFVGNVAAKAGGSFTFSVTIQKPTSYKNDENILAKLVELIAPPVAAVDNGREIVTTANIATPDPQSDTSKNNSSVVTYLVASEDSTSQPGEDPGLEPALEVTSTNNTGEYVYPGDVVTFFATVKNAGLGKALKTIVYQDIVLDGKVVVSNQFDLGEIEGGKKKKFTFTVRIPKKAAPGVYQSIISADAESTTGKIYSSNESITEFTVGSGSLATVPEVQKNTGEGVLAAESTVADNQMSTLNKLLYILAFVFSLLWYVEYIRRREAEEELDLILNKKKKSSIPFFSLKGTPLQIHRLLEELKKGIFALPTILTKKRFF